MSNCKTDDDSNVRPIGHVRVPSSVAVRVREYIAAHGENAAMRHFGLGRMALMRVAAGVVVQGATLFAAQEGLTRIASATGT